jgi:acetyl/propionyl-CoA carboxylase alpha subunit
MGDKMTARRLMRQAGVPVIPGEEINESDPEKELAAIHEASQRIGLPLMIKASAGGGGKGMRMVSEFSGVRGAAQAARREAEAAFGDGRVYIEKMLTSSRHIEIQILADSFSNVIHLGERECSVQRPALWSQKDCAHRWERLQSMQQKRYFTKVLELLNSLSLRMGPFIFLR